MKAWQMRTSRLALLGGALLFTGVLVRTARSDVDPTTPPTYSVEHPECTFFGPKHDSFVNSGLTGQNDSVALGRMTDMVVSRLGYYPGGDALEGIPGGSRTNTSQHSSARGTIDRYIFQAIQDAGVTPAPRTTDWEFIRRVTLDLTGRIPAPDRVLSFVNDPAADKRAKLVDELLAKPEWVDKWAMYFGDLYNNTTTNTTTGVQRYADGRNAFYTWLKGSLTANKPYDKLAYELISSTGTNSYDPAQGHMNWIVNGLVTNGPSQDAYDQEAANTAETFLGMSHMNCTLCHNGRGHLDALSLWGKQELRTTSWGLAAYFAKTRMSRTPVDGAVNGQPYYWTVTDNTGVDYTLGTLTGNRPARCLNNLPPSTVNGVLACGCADGSTPTIRNGQAVCAKGFGNITPVYPFNGHSPNPGENYRAAAAREITNDFQFARAAVNYMWKEFFGLGIVDPPNQFDPARLDPDNPPPDPWTLQPSNPRLLNALAQDFINSGYDLKALMKQICNSDAYQLSSRYSGATLPPDNLFARKLVRRLWAEEIHDAVVQASNILPSYTVNGNTDKFLSTSWAMQLPDTNRLPGGSVANFLDAFLRGNRDDEQRRPDGSLSQALDLMNDPFVMTRIRAMGAGANASLLAKSLTMADEQLVNNLWLNVLSRYPTDAEKQAALTALSSAQNTSIRQQKAENLLWSLYNKVDFIFNY